jgi:hypothetical protein
MECVVDESVNDADAEVDAKALPTAQRLDNGRESSTGHVSDVWFIHFIPFFSVFVVFAWSTWEEESRMDVTRMDVTLGRLDKRGNAPFSKYHRPAAIVSLF